MAEGATTGAGRPIPRSPLLRHPRLILLALLAGTVACLAIALTRPPTPSRGRAGDAALYRAIITRVQSGEPYYAATHDELLARQYGLQSVLNWRPPTLAHLVTSFPNPVYTKALLIIFAVGTLVTASLFMKQQGGFILACFLAIWLAGELLPSAIGDTYLFSEFWAGTLILLSILLYPRHPLLSAIPALAALFLRELAAPYVLLLTTLTLYDLRHPPRSQRLPALILLLIGLCVYTLFFLWHAHQVKLHLLPTDPAYPTGWIQFGGYSFLLSAVRQNAWLLCLPAWAPALYLPIAVLGLFTWPAPNARLALPAGIGYLALFAIAGKSFNDYWGLLITPTLCLSFCFGLSALPSLVRSSLHRTRRQPRHEVLLQCEEQ